ncbi:T-complex protein 11 [Arabidopsis lyrata subsp. lyrata]|uniref:T-complex protein 11 n=1 Tax=Arabidopsis lyrata subsp. lyrata TaxID=81972 RepID=D7LX78_ARALL|nr:T-complex protein 11 [Arabidopsis lyrata subsp. lyrata]
MTEPERLGGISLSFPANEEDTVTTTSPKTLPRRLRRRLLEPKSPVSAEEIDSKLREADLRRQQYYESLSSKARPKMRSPRSASIEELSQRLESKLNDAEQKRLSILEKELARLAKMDEARQAAKNGLEQRVEKERDELESKVEERVLKAEKNRMLLFKAMAQRRAAKRQRAAQSLMKKAVQEMRYKESVRAAIYQKRAAAESKRMGILEAERRRANARLTRVFGAASSVQSQKEAERKKMKDRLEERLQRAKKLKAQYMKRRRGMDSCSSSRSETMRKNQVHLVRMLERCWRRFTKYKKSTYGLARAYHSLGINEKSIESVPFEQFAIQMNSVSVIQTVKALLDRLEIRLALSKASNVENINHLLKHIFPPARRGKSPSSVSKGEQKSPNSKMGYQKLKKIARYPARIFLCAYMIKQHPGAIFRGRGEHEIALVESATYLIREFELLVKIILEGPECTLPDNVSFEAPRPKKFRSQLEAFDKAWCSYLEGFVVWKINDAKLLEKDIARTQEPELSEVSKHISSPTILKVSSPTNRALFAETDGAQESKAPADSHLPSSSSQGSSNLSPSLNSGIEGISTPNVTANSIDAALASENEVIVNEIVHDNSSSFADSFDPNTGDTNTLQVRVKETMEKAFWDGVMESMKQSQPDFSWVLKLMKEVRDELCEISPKDWRQEIVQTIDTDVLSQLLASGNVDMGYLGNILEFSLGILLKLSAPANEEEIRTTHHKLMTELGEIVPTEGHSNSSYAILMVKGLRFVLQQIQILKKEISKSRLKLLKPLLKGPAGLEYLKKSFSSRHGSPDRASPSLPLTKRWLLSVRGEAEREWKEHKDALSALTNNHSGSTGLPSTTMRTGGNISSVSKVNTPSSPFPGIELSECKGETVDLLVRLGLLKMVSEIGGLTLETVPETFQLNLSRLRAVQSQIQKITLVSISVLILQQTLVSENSSPIDMETITWTCINRLYEMLDAKPDAGLSEIMETLSKLLDSDDAETKKQVIANMLVKSLQAGDAVFTRVSQTIYLAIRAAVLAGNNTKRKQLVETMLRKIGAASLSDKVIEVSNILVLVATVSRSVHGLWYEELLKKPN